MFIATDSATRLRIIGKIFDKKITLFLGTKCKNSGFYYGQMSALDRSMF